MLQYHNVNKQLKIKIKKNKIIIYLIIKIIINFIKNQNNICLKRKKLLQKLLKLQ